jgi:hypothetical protein
MAGEATRESKAAQPKQPKHRPGRRKAAERGTATAMASSPAHHTGKIPPLNALNSSMGAVCVQQGASASNPNTLSARSVRSLVVHR